jgi:diketogulonate reductase-like aldo/keto reductase
MLSNLVIAALIMTFISPITLYPGGPVDPVINAVAKRLNAKPTQVLLSWVRSKGVAIVTCVALLVQSL